jgi:stage V sporulation protein S
MTEPDDSIVLKVGAGSDPRAVGSAVAHSLAEGKNVLLRAVGAGAVNQAVKAVAVATQWTSPRGYGLLMRAGFTDVPGREGGTISAVTLQIIKG